MAWSVWGHGQSSADRQPAGLGPAIAAGVQVPACSPPGSGLRVEMLRCGQREVGTLRSRLGNELVSTQQQAHLSCAGVASCPPFGAAQASCRRAASGVHRRRDRTAMRAAICVPCIAFDDRPRAA